MSALDDHSRLQPAWAFTSLEKRPKKYPEWSLVRALGVWAWAAKAGELRVEAARYVDSRRSRADAMSTGRPRALSNPLRRVPHVTISLRVRDSDRIGLRIGHRGLAINHDPLRSRSARSFGRALTGLMDIARPVTCANWRTRLLRRAAHRSLRDVHSPDARTRLPARFIFLFWDSEEGDASGSRNRCSRSG
jgi:hypothetical protein